MMLRNLQVSSFSGEPPTSRQMLLRSMGYMLSAGTFFLGFFGRCGTKTNLPGTTASRARI